MDTIEAPTQEDTRIWNQLICPICDGLLILLRGFYRCTRCGCHFCEACEGPSPAAE
jgi:hypothetical protein